MKEMHAAVSKDQSAIIANQMTRPQEGAPASAREMIETRFGSVRMKRDNPISFPKGLLGMPEKTNFCLLDFPIEKFREFKLLQSLDDDALSFITLPIQYENTIIDKVDIQYGCKELGFDEQATTLLLIVSVHRELKKIRLSCNARAPLFIHADKRIAQQYVLHNNKYLVRHMLTA